MSYHVGNADDVEGKQNLTTIQLVISGRVQGVFFRSSLKKVADEHFVTGWTRNLVDGTVEALLQGDENQVRNVIDWCQVGPKSARVDSVKETRMEEDGSYHNFAIIP